MVLLNLIGNAIKFTEHGSVHVDFSATAESAGEILFAVTVEDTGSGIDPAEQEKLFQFFSQAESGRLSQSGTGLSLASGQEYIRMMGGEIRVSNQVGAGSRFSFEIVLKLAEGEVKCAPTGAARRVVGLKDGRKAPRVLVAEDTEENRTLLVRQLGPLGMEIYSAADGQEAVDQFLRHQPDLIWMDIRMPVLDGIEATRRIKATAQEHGQKSLPFRRMRSNRRKTRCSLPVLMALSPNHTSLPNFIRRWRSYWGWNISMKWNRNPLARWEPRRRFAATLR